MNKYTAWLDSKYLPPTRRGVYQVTTPFPGYSLWNGLRWSPVQTNVLAASRRRDAAVVQRKRWRGLAKKP